MLRSIATCLAVAVLAAVTSAALAALAPPDYTFIWMPRSSDVGAAGASDYVALDGVLELAETQEYTVADGDFLDFIIRKQFLVSSSFPHAYALYRHRILDLNPSLRPDKLTVGSVIRIPTGPKFAGTELAGANVPAAARLELFSEMSVKASGMRSQTSEQAAEWSTRVLSAYVSPYKKATPGVIRSAIRERGLVAAIDVVKHPESRLRQAQAVSLRVGAAQQFLVRKIVQADPHAMHAGFFPVDDSFPADCHHSCVRCAQALKLPAGLDLSRARVLIEDTGIAAGLVDSAHLLPQKLGGNGQESAANSHGTFVFSEIAAPDPGEAPGREFGIIPKAGVYVMRVTQPTTYGQNFLMPDMLDGWNHFQALIQQDPHAAKTGVINISAASGPDPPGTQPPTVLDVENLLFVAAAGNNNSKTEPLLYAFGRFASPGMPLLIVGAQDVDGKKAIYSNFSGSNVHFMALGNCVCGAPGQLNGTSQATPIVTAAAAVLASQRPAWTALYVMWRLVSTADQAPELADGVFAGTVNVSQALDTLIRVKTGPDEAHAMVHRVSTLAFDGAWVKALRVAGLDDATLALLRLYSPTALGGHRCFFAVQYMQPGHKQACVDPDGVLTLTENGQTISTHAKDVVDVILPMPAERDDGTTWPTITVAGVGG